MKLSIGFTGTRYGMAPGQRQALLDLIDQLLVFPPYTTFPCEVHHGMCVGADEDFHRIMREIPGAHIVGHPGPTWPDGKWSADVLCDETVERRPYMRRNADIVAAAHVMIATPFGDEPQASGWTWSTIRMALRSVKLNKLYVIGRDGKMLTNDTLA